MEQTASARAHVTRAPKSTLDVFSLQHLTVANVRASFPISTFVAAAYERV